MSWYEFALIAIGAWRVSFLLIDFTEWIGKGSKHGKHESV